VGDEREVVVDVGVGGVDQSIEHRSFQCDRRADPEVPKDGDPRDLAL
jgi:hypothetical protein